MTNGEKLGYDSEKLKKYFAEFVKAWPDKANIDWNGCLPAYESLKLDYKNYNYKTFVDWMNSEFKEFKHLDLLPGGIIVLDKDNENITFVKVLFSVTITSATSLFIRLPRALPTANTSASAAVSFSLL